MNRLRLLSADASLAVGLSRCAAARLPRLIFRIASRAGDGPAYFAAMLSITALYRARTPLILDMRLAAGMAVGALIYLTLKRQILRERPYVRHEGIVPRAVPFDRGSFPSGHAMQASIFSVELARRFPHFLIPLIALAALIGVSRVALGLHYPSDVIAGALIGAAIAVASTAL